MLISPMDPTNQMWIGARWGRVIMVSGYGKQVHGERDIKIAQMNHGNEIRPHLEDLLVSVAEGTIRAVVEAKYSFAEALKALEKTETRHARGKLVVRLEH